MKSVNGSGKRKEKIYLLNRAKLIGKRQLILFYMRA